jgi:selenocysteine-specific translation elongation factor
LGLEGLTVGVYGTDQKSKGEVEDLVAKKSEAEGIIIYHRKEGERRISFLDDLTFPERIQGYAKVASLSDYALYVFPPGWKLTTPDGELAVLLESFKIPGSIALRASKDSAEGVRGAFRGTIVGSYDILDSERMSYSSPLDLPGSCPREDFRSEHTLIYVDRAFNVKGLGTVALGFIVSGKVSLHDSLRPIPFPTESKAEVKGIQLNDVDHEEAGRGMRVGLALRGVDAKDLQRTHWLDDGSFALTDSLQFKFTAYRFYTQSPFDRDVHLQLPGEMVTASLSKGDGKGGAVAKLATQVPVWAGMRLAVIDLNGKLLRVAGGGMCNV